MKSFLRQIEESFQTLNENAKPDFLDLDKDGNTTEPMKKAAKEADRPECDSCYGSGCDRCKNTGMKPEYQNVERCSKCKGKGCEHCNGKGYHEKVDEMSTTTGVAGFNTPAAFSKRTNPKLNQSTGYRTVSNKKLHTEYDQVQEAMDRKYEQLIEGYRNFALSDSKITPEQKVKKSISEVAKQLKTIEETIKYTSRLKTESGISHSGFGNSTKNALTKISERLIKISERVRSLGE